MYSVDLLNIQLVTETIRGFVNIVVQCALSDRDIVLVFIISRKLFAREL